MYLALPILVHTGTTLNIDRYITIFFQQISNFFADRPSVISRKNHILHRIAFAVLSENAEKAALRINRYIFSIRIHDPVGILKLGFNNIAEIEFLETARHLKKRNTFETVKRNRFLLRGQNHQRMGLTFFAVSFAQSGQSGNHYNRRNCCQRKADPFTDGNRHYKSEP